MASTGKRKRRASVTDQPRVRLLRAVFRLGRLAPGLAARLAERVWFTVPRFPTPPRERDAEARARVDFIDSDHGPLAVYQWGEASAPPVLLLHGWAGRATQMYAFIEPLLAAGYRAVALDAPAHGRSPGRQTNIFEIVHALEQLDTRFGPFAGAIAHSFGVPSCMLALHEQRLHCARLVGISPPFDLIGMLDKFCDILDIPPAVKARMRTRIGNRLGEHVWQRIRVDQVAPQLRQPALIIHDERDREVPIEEGRRTAAAWPGAELLVTRGHGHRRILRAPEVTGAAVAFIAGAEERLANEAG